MNWRAYLKPKSWYKANKINSEKVAKSFLFVGRRFGKTRLTSIEASAFIGGEEGRKKAIEFWNKVDRGEI